MRQSDLRDLTANMLSEVCKDIEVKPKLAPLTGEELDSRTAKTTNEARLDIRGREVWERGQQALLDLRVFDPNACRYLNKLLQQCHVMNEKEKKRKEHTMREFCKLNMVHLHHWFFSIYGNTGRECRTFYSSLSNLLSEKRDLPKSITMNWIRTKICFALLKSSLLCLIGSQTVPKGCRI